MRSPTYGELTFAQIAGKIASYIMAHGLDRQYELSVGTDSQNFDDTKMVRVVTLHDVGHGGIFFYDVRRMRKIMNVREKLTVETTYSLECAQQLLDAVEAFQKTFGFDITKYVHFSIHVDAGPNGRSRDSINEICGWVRACGYDVHTKPESYAASSIANKISK